MWPLTIEFKTVAKFVGLYLVLLSALVFFANFRLYLGEDNAYAGKNNALPTMHWFYGYNLVRWDAGEYFNIIENGYSPTKAVFFPLYPELVSTLQLTGLSFAVASSLLSLTFAILGIWIFYLWAKDYLQSERKANESLWWLLFFPTSFFFFAPYTESLFFLLLVLILYGLNKKNNWLIFASGYFIALTRFAGIFALILFMGDWWRNRRENGALKTLILRSFFPIAGLASYMTYLQVKFDDALAFINGQTAWNRNTELSLSGIVGRWQGYIQEFIIVYDPSNLSPILSRATDIIFLLFAAALTILIYKRYNKEYAIFMTATITLPLLSGTLLSMPRYILPLPFIFIYLADTLTDKPIGRWLQTLSIVMWTVFLTMFTSGYWVA
jgi:Gpi18-like mannosyltransferase